MGLQADTIIPEPGNPQALNRYSYVLNNALKYTDPTGHDWRDAADFLYGFAAQWASNNAWMAPQLQQDLAVKPNETLPTTVGRHLGNVGSLLQGLAEVAGGSSVAAGGGVICLTGVGCVAGAPVAVGAAAVTAHGVTVAIAGAAAESQMLGTALFSSTEGLSSGSIPTVFRGGSNLVPRLSDVKIDAKSGLIQPTKGVSLFSDPAKVEKFGGAFRVDAIPDGLKIIQRGSDPFHFEIVPIDPMTWERYVDLLQRVKLTSVTGP